MKRNTLFNIIATAALAALVSCTDSNTVKISGTVNDGQGEKLLLMHLNGSNPTLVDSLTLGADGSFNFKPEVEQGGPDFFCLVCNGQTIPVVSDTLQTPIEVTAQKEKFGTTYQVKDSLNNELRKAVALGGDLRRQMLNLATQHNQGKVSDLIFADSLSSMVNTYKANILDQYIYKYPASPVSYYLLFETVQGMQIFNPYDAKDNRAYGAVANLWLHTYPNSKRTEFLEQRTREGMALRRQALQDMQRNDSLLQTKINESNFIDINLVGTNDANVPFSSVCGHGDITLLDFTAFYITDVAVPHNERLNKVYAKYKDQGLKIYQVCLDPQINFWKIAAANLPWTVVRDTELYFDENGMVQYSAAAALYNVTNIPTTFIMARDGSPLIKVEDDTKLDAEVAKRM